MNMVKNPINFYKPLVIITLVIFQSLSRTRTTNGQINYFTPRVRSLYESHTMLQFEGYPIVTVKRPICGPFWPFLSRSFRSRRSVYRFTWHHRGLVLAYHGRPLRKSAESRTIGSLRTISHYEKKKKNWRRVKSSLGSWVSLSPSLHPQCCRRRDRDGWWTGAEGRVCYGSLESRSVLRPIMGGVRARLFLRFFGFRVFFSSCLCRDVRQGHGNSMRARKRERERKRLLLFDHFGQLKHHPGLLTNIC